MNPVGLGQQYPMYANCFDRLTTNGILVDDVMGYITGQPSPYLQNYVAQRGGWPTLPGQIMPDALPGAPAPAPMAVQGSYPQKQQTQMPNGSIYKDIPTNLDQNTFVKNDKYEKYKKIGAGLLLGGLIGLGLFHGVKLFRNGGKGFKQMLANSWQSIKKSCKKGWKSSVKFLKTAYTKTINFFKNMWNKIFHKTP